MAKLRSSFLLLIVLYLYMKYASSLEIIENPSCNKWVNCQEGQLISYQIKKDDSQGKHCHWYISAKGNSGVFSYTVEFAEYDGKEVHWDSPAISNEIIAKKESAGHGPGTGILLRSEPPLYKCSRDTKDYNITSLPTKLLIEEQYYLLVEIYPGRAASDLHFMVRCKAEEITSYVIGEGVIRYP